jgi:Zn-dependent protease with chaperone function
VVLGDGVERREPMGAVTISDAVGTAPRFVRFADGAVCEIADPAFAGMVARSRVAQWEQSSGAIAAAVVFLAAVIGLGIQFGLPAMANSAADRLPPDALDTLSRQVLRALDHTVFQPTGLPGRRHAALLNGFDALRLPSGDRTRLRLEFRKSDAIGANALALPSGTIVVTDELVALTDRDVEVLAVVAHEVGHVEKRHGLRKIVQSSIATVLLTWYLGDVNVLAAAAPTALLRAKYSRDLEREADAYAAEVFALNGLSIGALADMLERLDATRATPAGRPAGGPGYLSSHPSTAERTAWLRSR